MRQILTALLISYLIVYGISLSADATESQDKSLLIAAFDYKPFVNQDSDKHGYIAEIATAALQIMGYKVEYLFVPLKRALRHAQSGTIDGVLGAYYAEERTAYLVYSAPMGNIRVNFFTRKDTNISFAKPGDLKPYTVGVLLGTSLIEALQRDGLKTEPASGNTNNLKKLLARRIDLFVGTTDWILYDLHSNFSKEEQEQVIVLDPPYQVQQIYFTMSKKKRYSKIVIEDFNNGLKRIKADGLYKIILDRYRVTQ